MFVYTLIGAQIVPLNLIFEKELRLHFVNTFNRQHTHLYARNKCLDMSNPKHIIVK